MAPSISAKGGADDEEASSQDRDQNEGKGNSDEASCDSKDGNDSTQRVRSSSTSSVSSHETSNAVTIVSKAKRAADFLWMILHAQGCRKGVYSCRFKGCAEAKLILLHVKTCAASSSEECPGRIKGCNQTRKLLAHYKRCREVRSRLPQHVCLVCSIMARKARTVLESVKTPASPGSSNQIKNKTILSSFTLPRVKQSRHMPSTCIPKSFSTEQMPPPSSRQTPMNNYSKQRDRSGSMNARFENVALSSSCPGKVQCLESSLDCSEPNMLLSCPTSNSKDSLSVSERSRTIQQPPPSTPSPSAAGNDGTLSTIINKDDFVTYLPPF